MCTGDRSDNVTLPLGEPVALRDGQDKVLLSEPLDAVPGPQAGVLRADTLD
jgi:hypothetical protein